MISVVVIGAGNVGSHLVKAFQSAEKVNLVQWYSRDKMSIKAPTKGIELCNDLKDLKSADIYIIAVTDKAIEALSKQLPFENRLVVHTSGSVALKKLDMKHKRGVFYPLQTFSKTSRHFHQHQSTFSHLYYESMCLLILICLEKQLWVKRQG